MSMTDQAREQNKRDVGKLFETFNQGDLGLVDELVKTVVVGLRSAFPDLHYTLDDVVAEGDQVAVRWHWTGTHKGPFRAFPATGKAVSNTGAGIFRFKDGKNVAASLETDRLGFLEQIGAVPENIGQGPRPPRP